MQNDDTSPPPPPPRYLSPPPGTHAIELHLSDKRMITELDLTQGVVLEKGNINTISDSIGNH